MTEKKTEPFSFMNGEETEGGQKKFERPENLRTIYSMSCSGEARDFFGLVQEYAIQAVVDTRVNRTFRGRGFSSQESDFAFICELIGVPYYVLECLAPTQEMRQDFARTFKDVKKAADRDPEAWTRYLRQYEEHLMMTRPFRRPVFREVVYGKFESIAIVCSCAHHDDCHRSYACGLMTTVLPDVNLEILYPNNQPPARRSPRRYRLEDFPWANLKAEKPRR